MWGILQYQTVFYQKWQVFKFRLVFKVTSNLRGCPPEKKLIRALFKETPTNYVPTERLKNVEFDKIMFCFEFCFSKAIGYLFMALSSSTIEKFA